MMPASVLAIVQHRISSGGCHYPDLALAPQVYSGHRPLSLKILHIEFFLTLDFRHLCTYIKNLMSEIKIMSPYHSVQMRS